MALVLSRAQVPCRYLFALPQCRQNIGMPTAHEGTARNISGSPTNDYVAGTAAEVLFDRADTTSSPSSKPEAEL
jgi:hypothetical protein